MQEVRIYKCGEKIAIFKNVVAIVYHSSGDLEICSDMKWIQFKKGDFDWFNVL